MSSADESVSRRRDEHLSESPEAELDRQGRQAGRIVQSLAVFIGGAIIYSFAASAALEVLGLTAALLSTLASISIALQNLDLPGLSRPAGTGFHNASWGKVASVILTVIALVADIVTIALIISVH